MSFATRQIGVLLTCFNRKRQTLACLERLSAQPRNGSFNCDVILVDDGSTDGTHAAVREAYPAVDVLTGTGSLYWAGGMRMAMRRAAERRYDFVLLLNDDTILSGDALDVMLRTYEWAAGSGQAASIVVGSTKDPLTGELTYGGWRSVGRFAPTKCIKLHPGDVPQRCDTMNGNCVLIPKAVLERVGMLDDSYTHAMADLDYGFRATRQHCSIWLAPGYIGTCAANSDTGSWRDKSLPVMERWRKLLGPKGLPPREWRVFNSRHAGPLWGLYWIAPYVKFWLDGARRGSVQRSRAS